MASDEFQRVDTFLTGAPGVLPFSQGIASWASLNAWATGIDCLYVEEIKCQNWRSHTEMWTVTTVEIMSIRNTILFSYFVFVTICSQWVFASVTAHWTSGLSASYTIITISYIAIFNTLIDRVTLKWPRLYFKIKQVILYPLSLSFILK
jgi:hypothetical protein